MSPSPNFEKVPSSVLQSRSRFLPERRGIPIFWHLNLKKIHDTCLFTHVGASLIYSVFASVVTLPAFCVTLNPLGCNRWPVICKQESGPSHEQEDRFNLLSGFSRVSCQECCGGIKLMKRFCNPSESANKRPVLLFSSETCETPWILLEGINWMYSCYKEDRDEEFLLYKLRELKVWWHR